MNAYYLAALAVLILLSTCCGTTNVLQLKNKRYYHEENILKIGGSCVLKQIICYNNPRVIDDEHCYRLTIWIKNPEFALQKQKLDLAIDTAIVASQYEVTSVWNWSDRHFEVSGTLDILRWTPAAVTLKERLVVKDPRNGNMKTFRGTRRFALSASE